MTRELCEEYDRDGDAYRRGSKPFNFSRNVYGHESVKTIAISSSARQMLLLRIQTGRYLTQGGGALQTKRSGAAGVRTNGWSTPGTTGWRIAGAICS